MRLVLLIGLLCTGCHKPALAPPRLFLPTVVGPRSNVYSIDADRSYIAATNHTPHVLRDRRDGSETVLPPISRYPIGRDRFVFIGKPEPGRQSWRVYDIDPARPALRLLYEDATADWVLPIGVDGDRLLFTVKHAGEYRIVTLWPTGSRQEIVDARGTGLDGFDLVRGQRVLLAGPTRIDPVPRDAHNETSQTEVRYSARVYVLDLDTGQRRDLGQCFARCSELGDRNVPHAKIRWITAAERERSDPASLPSHACEFGGYVVEETEALIQTKPDEPNVAG